MEEVAAMFWVLTNKPCICQFRDHCLKCLLKQKLDKYEVAVQNGREINMCDVVHQIRECLKSNVGDVLGFNLIDTKLTKLDESVFSLNNEVFNIKTVREQFTGYQYFVHQETALVARAMLVYRSSSWLLDMLLNVCILF